MSAMSWLTGPIAKACGAVTKAELDQLRADLPGLVETAVKAGVDELLNHITHPFGHAAALEPLEAPPITEHPDSAAKPLDAEQRAGLEKLRNRYAPDRQNPSLRDLRRQTGQNADSSLDRMRGEHGS